MSWAGKEVRMADVREQLAARVRRVHAEEPELRQCDLAERFGVSGCVIKNILLERKGYERKEART